jgi:Phasin protein
MAKETGSSQHRTGAPNRTAEQMMKGMANLTPLGIMHHATKHVTAALTFTRKLSQATDLHDRMRIHAEHAQMHIELFNERAKHLGNAMAVARNLVGAVASQMRLHQHLGEAAGKSSEHKPAEGEGHARSSRSKR